MNINKESYQLKFKDFIELKLNELNYLQKKSYNNEEEFTQLVTKIKDWHFDFSNKVIQFPSERKILNKVVDFSYNDLINKRNDLNERGEKYYQLIDKQIENLNSCLILVGIQDHAATQKSEKKRDNSEIVFILHGILSNADYIETVKSIIEQNTDYRVEPLKYGYIDLISSFFPSLTKIFVIDRVEGCIRSFKNDNKVYSFSIIAHSFGSFIITELLKVKTDIIIKDLILCGSIVKRNFIWENVRQKISGRIINECGHKDLLPIIASTYFFFFGASGVLGFYNTKEVNNRYHNVGHNDYFKEKFVIENWLPLILNENIDLGIVENKHKRSVINSTLLFILTHLRWLILLSIVYFLFKLLLI